MIARKFVPLRDFSSCEFTPLKESKCKILHPRRSCITPLNVPYSVFWHAYHRKFTADYAFGTRLSSREPCDLGAVRLAAAIALASPMFRLDGGQSSTLPSFSPVAGVHSSGLNKRLHLAAKTSDRHRQKPAVISAPLFSCSGAFTRRVAAGTSPIPRHKKPESLKLAFSGLRHKPGAGWPESAIP